MEHFFQCKNSPERSKFHRIGR